MLLAQHPAHSAIRSPSVPPDDGARLTSGRNRAGRYNASVTSVLTEWVELVFGQAIPGEYGVPRLEGICGPDQQTLDRLSQVFEDPTLLQHYPDAVLDRAFWDVWDAAFRAVYDSAIDWRVRYRFIRSFDTLFRRFFAGRCAPVLNHLGEEGGPLNVSRYMWFDPNCWLFLRHAKTPNPCDAAMLASIRSILAIDHTACQEAALHGLGHRPSYQRAGVQEIIDRFLTANPGLTESLRSYALACRSGQVL